MDKRTSQHGIEGRDDQAADKHGLVGGTARASAAAAVDAAELPALDLVEPNDTLAQAADLSERLRADGSVALASFIGDNPALDAAENNVDLALFALRAGDYVAFGAAADGSGLDTVLRVFDAEGRPLALNDDIATATAASIFWRRRTASMASGSAATAISPTTRTS